MKFLFFDIETTGLPLNYKASYRDLDNWPRVISLAWILVRDNSTTVRTAYNLIKPDGWEIPNEKFWIENGYSTDKSNAEGIPIKHALDEMMEAKQEASLLVAHNLNFDHAILWAEFLRAGMEPRTGMNKVCTMMAGTSVAKLPGKFRGQYKWPKLEELYQCLFAKGFEGAHDALADVTACRDCFFELVKRKVIMIPTQEIL